MPREYSLPRKSKSPSRSRWVSNAARGKTAARLTTRRAEKNKTVISAHPASGCFRKRLGFVERISTLLQGQLLAALRLSILHLDAVGGNLNHFVALLDHVSFDGNIDVVLIGEESLYRCLTRRAGETEELERNRRWRRWSRRSASRPTRPHDGRHHGRRRRR